MISSSFALRMLNAPAAPESGACRGRKRVRARGRARAGERARESV